MWMKNSDGKKDAVLTMAFMGFIVVLVKILIGGVSIKLANHDVSLGVIDAATVGAVLTPTLGAYVARKYTDKKYHRQEKEKVANGA